MFGVWVVAASSCPRLWLFVVPAALPLLNFSPWTGWLVVEEFDLLMLGTLAAGFARRAWARRDAAPAGDSRWLPDAGSVLVIAFAGVSLVAFWRGIVDAGGWSVDWFDGYTQAANTARVGKSLLWALALWPSIDEALEQSARSALRSFAFGMQTGLALVGLAVLWERAAYPGLLNFSTRYRTTALFWEMHVGGGAIDAYLAMAAPFAAWALWSARSRRAWAVSAALALLTGHACLTTFSRGAYVAVAVPLLLLGIGRWWHRRDVDARAAWRALAWALCRGVLAAAILLAAFETLVFAGLGLALLALIGSLRLVRSRWRQAAALGLTLALMTETTAVLGGGSFMRERLTASERDFGSRLAHWSQGVGLLHGPADWLLGIGLGRLPARYAQSGAGGEFSGAVRLLAADAGLRPVQLAGPATDARLGGLYALTQRVTLDAGGAYRVALAARAEVATDLQLSVCELHLLYARTCQSAFVRVLPRGAAWQHMSVELQGARLERGHWYAPRLGEFAVAALGAGTAVDLARVSLSDPSGAQRLLNGNFAAALAHWVPAARRYFLPWHIDSVGLELLIERGLAGLALGVAMLTCALWQLVRELHRGSTMAPFLAASLLGALLVGLVNSVLDSPRAAFLLSMIVLLILQISIHDRRRFLQVAKVSTVDAAMTAARTAPTS